MTDSIHRGIMIQLRQEDYAALEREPCPLLKRVTDALYREMTLMVLNEVVPEDYFRRLLADGASLTIH